MIVLSEEHVGQNGLGLAWPCVQQASTYLKAALRVLFFLTKAILTRPSHSFSGEKETKLNIYNLPPVLINWIFTALTINRVKPHLEVNWRRWIFRFYPDNTWLHFWRRTEIVLPYLVEGGNINTETQSLQHWKMMKVNHLKDTVTMGFLESRCCHVRQTLTFIRWSTRASSCVFMDSLQNSLSPGLATSRMANSLWNINTAHLSKSKNTKESLNAQRGHAKIPVKNSQWAFLPEERSMKQELEDKRWRNLHN